MKFLKYGVVALSLVNFSCGSGGGSSESLVVPEQVSRSVYVNRLADTDEVEVIVQLIGKDANRGDEAIVAGYDFSANGTKLKWREGSWQSLLKRQCLHTNQETSFKARYFIASLKPDKDNMIHLAGNGPKGELKSLYIAALETPRVTKVSIEKHEYEYDHKRYSISAKMDPLSPEISATGEPLLYYSINLYRPDGLLSSCSGQLGNPEVESRGLLPSEVNGKTEYSVGYFMLTEPTGYGFARDYVVTGAISEKKPLKP